MKKLLKKLAVLPLFFGLLLTSACSSDPTFIDVRVTTAGSNPTPRAGVAVHLFMENHGPGTAFFRPIHSRRSVITGSDGVASFELEEFELAFSGNQTTFHFGVFGGSSSSPTILGTGSITVREGDRREVVIRY